MTYPVLRLRNNNDGGFLNCGTSIPIFYSSPLVAATKPFSSVCKSAGEAIHLDMEPGRTVPGSSGDGPVVWYLLLNPGEAPSVGYNQS